MNNLYKVISTVLMIALILVLVWILVNYYKETPTVSPSIVNPSLNTTTIPERSGEDDSSLFQKQKESEDENVDVVQNDINDKPEETQNEEKKDPIIITSSEQTSNKEKQEVLTEIDKTLMELLKVVDKVQTVDETRLGIDESEVQP